MLDYLGEGMQVSAAVRINTALRRASGTAGIVYGYGVVLVLQIQPDIFGTGAGDEFFISDSRQHLGRRFSMSIAAIKDIDVDLDIGKIFGIDPIGNTGVNEQDARSRQVDDGGDFPGAEAVVDGDNGAAGQRNAIVGFKQGGKIARYEGDVIAPCDSDVLESITQPIDTLEEIPPAPSVIPVDYRSSMRHNRSDPLQETQWC